MHAEFLVQRLRIVPKRSFKVRTAPTDSVLGFLGLDLFPMGLCVHPVVLLQGRKSSSDRLIECFRRDLHGVFYVLDILRRNCARSENRT